MEEATLDVLLGVPQIQPQYWRLLYESTQQQKLDNIDLEGGDNDENKDGEEELAQM